jgi:uncharacterized protein (DUF697 family)
MATENQTPPNDKPNDKKPAANTEAAAPAETAPKEAAANDTAANETAPSDTVTDAPETDKTAAEAIETRASCIIRKHVLMSAATAAIPANFLDIAALAAVQLNLLKELAGIHSLQFNTEISRSAIGTLLAVVAPTALSNGVMGSMAVRLALCSIPVIGPAIRLLTQPAFNAAFTYALGKVFHMHFASGGTFLTFDPEKVKAYFVKFFKEARDKGVKGSLAAA